MPTLGITGGLASGKSTVAAAFGELGAAVIDADQIAHELMARGGTCVSAISDQFGEDVIDDGAVNRRALAKIVFADRSRLRELEAIIHPAVEERIKSRIEEIEKAQPGIVIVVDVPLLFEAGMEGMVDKTIVVRCDEEQQIQRAGVALKITKQDALLRIQSQMSLEEKAERADIVIDNKGSKSELINEVKLIWQKVL